jgi:predicted phosphodiesterase
MRLAILADVHGNLHALDAVLADIDARGDIAATHHLGDLVGYSAYPNEVVERLWSRGVSGIAGNYDSTVATHAAHCGCRSDSAAQEALAHASFHWTVDAVTAETRARLAALPFRTDLKPLGGHARGPTLTLVHGTPTLNTVYWTAERDDAFCRKMIGHAGLTAGDALFMGHTHVPWQRTVDGVLLVNAGSVGRPKDGDPRACYVVVTVDSSGLQVEHVRVTYDVAAAGAAVIAAGLPAEFAAFLAAGGRAPGASATATPTF